MEPLFFPHPLSISQPHSAGSVNLYAMFGYKTRWLLFDTTTPYPSRTASTLMELKRVGLDGNIRRWLPTDTSLSAAAHDRSFLFHSPPSIIEKKPMLFFGPFFSLLFHEAALLSVGVSFSYLARGIRL